MVCSTYLGREANIASLFCNMRAYLFNSISWIVKKNGFEVSIFVSTNDFVTIISPETGLNTWQMNLTGQIAGVIEVNFEAFRDHLILVERTVKKFNLNFARVIVMAK